MKKEIWDGLEISKLNLNVDERGYLTELFRIDEIALDDTPPKMGYLSLSKDGILRGPHEHKYQTDVFIFLGKFDIYLWDNRPDSITYEYHHKLRVDKHTRVIIPHGIVHAYKSIGDNIVLNFPTQLYQGWGKKKKVDEIRWEDKLDSPFQI